MKFTKRRKIKQQIANHTDRVTKLHFKTSSYLVKLWFSWVSFLHLGTHFRNLSTSNFIFRISYVISAPIPQHCSLSRKSIPCKSHTNCDTVSQPNVSHLHVSDRKCILYVTHIFVEISSIHGTSLLAWQPPGEKPCWDWSPHPVLHVQFIQTLLLYVHNKFQTPQMGSQHFTALCVGFAFHDLKLRSKQNCRFSITSV